MAKNDDLTTFFAFFRGHRVVEERAGEKAIISDLGFCVSPSAAAVQALSSGRHFWPFCVRVLHKEAGEEGEEAPWRCDFALRAWRPSDRLTTR